MGHLRLALARVESIFLKSRSVVAPEIGVPGSGREAFVLCKSMYLLDGIRLGPRRNYHILH